MAFANLASHASEYAPACISTGCDKKNDLSAFAWIFCVLKTSQVA